MSVGRQRRAKMTSIESHQSEDDGHLFANEKFSLVRRLERTTAQVTRCVCDKTRQLTTVDVQRAQRRASGTTAFATRASKCPNVTSTGARVARARTCGATAAVRGRALLSRYANRKTRRDDRATITRHVDSVLTRWGLQRRTVHRVEVPNARCWTNRGLWLGITSFVFENSYLRRRRPPTDPPHA